MAVTGGFSSAMGIYALEGKVSDQQFLNNYMIY